MEIVRSTHCNHHKHLKVPALIPIKQIWHCTIAVKNAGRRGVFDDKASVQFSTDQGGGKSRSGNGTAFEFLCYSALGETPITPFGWRAVGAHKKPFPFERQRLRAVWIVQPIQTLKTMTAPTIRTPTTKPQPKKRGDGAGTVGFCLLAMHGNARSLTQFLMRSYLCPM